MSRNVLYNVIQVAINPESALPGGLVTHERTHRSGSKYFLFELPLDDNTLVDTYRLTSHHLSVFAKATNELDAKSEYHYTAYFKDELDKNYQLHVYFDNQDNLLFKPLLSELMSNNEYKSINDQDNEEVFKNLANKAISSLVFFLRTEQKKLIRLCQATYAEIEKKADALYQALPESKSDYLIVVDELIKQLDALARFSSPTQATISTQHFLNSLKRSIQDIELPKRSEETSLASPKQSTLLSQNKTHTPKTKTKSHHSQKPSIRNALKDLTARFEKINRLKAQEQISTIKPLYAELTENQWLLNLGEYTGSIHDIYALKALKEKTEELGKNLLQNLLITNQFEKAEQLKLFYCLLPAEQITNMALHFNKPQLLDNLLKNKVINAHSKTITIANNTYASFIDYCLKTTSDRHNTLACLEVLLEHGASILEINPETGMPYVVALLLNQIPLLSPLVTTNKIHNFLLYIQLRQVLLMLAPQFDCTTEKRKTIEELVSFLNLKVIELRTSKIKEFSKNKALSEKTANYANELDEEIGKLISAEMLESFQRDPELLALDMRLETKFDSLSARLSKQQKKSLLTQANNYLSNTIEELKNLDSDSIQLSFSELKSLAIQNKLARIKRIELIDELLTIQNTLLGIKQIKSPTEHKQYQALKIREEALVKQIQKETTAIETSLSKKLQAGITIFKRLEDFVKEISKFEESYTNPSALLKLATTLLTDAEKEERHLHEIELDSNESEKTQLEAKKLRNLLNKLVFELKIYAADLEKMTCELPANTLTSSPNVFFKLSQASEEESKANLLNDDECINESLQKK